MLSVKKITNHLNFSGIITVQKDKGNEIYNSCDRLIIRNTVH